MFFQLAKYAVFILLIIFFVHGVGWFLSPKDDLEEADVIVAISGGNTEARTRQAINLYKEGWAGKLIFAGAAFDPSSPSNASVMRDIAQEEEVPLDDIYIDEKSQNTQQNADEVAKIAKTNNFKKIILVTSAYHQRRAYMEFRHALPDDVQIINHPAEDKSWNPNWWWLSPYGWFITVSESIKIPFTAVKNAANISITK